MSEVCKKCGCIFKEWKINPRTFTNGTFHLEARCPECNWFYKYMPQKEGTDFKLYFGKYSGKMVSEVMREDFEYLWWLLENYDKQKFRDKLQKTIDSLSKKT